jgi:hypothetical protein
MIVQGAAPGAEHFVITMDQHTAFAGRLAALFGNNQFEPVAPRDLMLHIVSHHDAGWRELDRRALRDPSTGLPYHLVKTPFAYIVETSSLSPDFNAKEHAYCELLSSMHSWGLYNGRYGMSDKVLLNDLAAENRTIADAMLDKEIERQERLKSALAADPETISWIDDAHLFQNYKQLQFFDTLSLYFHCIPEGERGVSKFTHVPQNAHDDTEVTVIELENGTYAFDPYPFCEDGVELQFGGRWLAPVAEGPDVREMLERAPVASQKVRFIARH